MKILVVAYPGGQGQINPSIRFAHRLLKMGANVTFTTSFSGVRGLIKKQTITDNGGLTFAPFSDAYDKEDQPSAIIQEAVSDFAAKGAPAVAKIIKSAADAGQPFDNLVYTPLVPWAAIVADAHKLKSTLLWCQHPTILHIYYYYFNGYQDLVPSVDRAIALPGLPRLTVDDLPSFLLPSRPKEQDFIVQVLKDHIDALKTSPRVLVNTFDELEPESIRVVEKLELFPVGPLVPMEFLDGKGNGVESLDDCIKWLDTKPKSSVVYVSFGSLAALSMDQLEEIASGLLDSNRAFLWVIRDGDQAKRLSKTEELKKQGMIVEWCSQVAVLSHDAIGCFVMHGGWNSTTEALISGVPTVVFAQWSDQGMNAKMIEDVWKTGVRVKKRGVDGMVEGKEIHRCVEMVMSRDDIRKNATKYRDLAREALDDGGSSTLKLRDFLAQPSQEDGMCVSISV